MKNRNYTIIDHFGSITNEDLLKEAYKKAFELASFKAYTIKNFIKTVNPNQFTEVSNKQKNFIRLNKQPNQVIIIVGGDETAKTRWFIDQWAEKVNDLKILYVTDHIEISTFEEEYPHFFFEDNAVMSRYRRCAIIWSKALDYEFSAPLVRDVTWAMNEGFFPRPDKKELAEAVGAHISKISTRPEKFRATKAVASEKECQQFFKYYRYLYENDLLKEFVESNLEDGLAKWKICPHCGRPVNLHEEFCTWCNTPNSDFRDENTSFFDTEEIEEEA